MESLLCPIKVIRFLSLHNYTAFPTSNLEHPGWKRMKYKALWLETTWKASTWKGKKEME
jgi:hypothetical protein